MPRQAIGVSGCIMALYTMLGWRRRKISFFRPQGRGPLKMDSIRDNFSTSLSKASICFLKCGSVSVMSRGIHPSIDELPHDVCTIPMGMSANFSRWYANAKATALSGCRTFHRPSQRSCSVKATVCLTVNCRKFLTVEISALISGIF